MNFSVRFTEKANEDIDSIAMYINDHDGLESALYVAKEIRKKADKLGYFPERGGRPLELLKVGRMEFREISFGPYRVFYRIENDTVWVVAVADGRRDIAVFLADRFG